VVAGNVVGFYSFANPAEQVLHYFHMTLRPIAFTELPNVDDVAIQDHDLRLHRPEVMQ